MLGSPPSPFRTVFAWNKLGELIWRIVRSSWPSLALDLGGKAHLGRCTTWILGLDWLAGKEVSSRYLLQSNLVRAG
uniref:Uncharacterized protein n=1 Tax=Sphaerodactylus townsendi TaxID=933632 RepID=A0ACB8GBQ6_9SAUR